MVMRGAKRKGVRYFGPYAHAYAIRETLDLLLRTFPIRTCTKDKFDRYQRLGRPCLYAHIEKCAAPCVGAVSREEYDGLVAELLQFLDGDTAPILDRLDKQMHEASDALEFERAARLRDQIVSVRKAIERQQMVDAKEEDYDAIGIVEDALEASVQVFLVRKGRVVGRKGLVVDKVEDLTRAELVGRLLEQLYGGARCRRHPARDPRARRSRRRPALRGVPRRVRAARRCACACRKRGAKRELLETVTQNAQEAFVRHKLRRASDHNARARALLALQEALALPEAPLRIECFDISNLQGTEIVASMVVMEDGLAKRSDYRRFKIRHQAGKTTSRRWKRCSPAASVATSTSATKARARASGSRTRRTCCWSTAARVSSASRCACSRTSGSRTSRWPAWPSGSKRSTCPGDPEPVRIPRDSEALYLLQQVRDEAHRFAITYHRQLRAKKMTKSVLDDVPGLGPDRGAPGC